MTTSTKRCWRRPPDLAGTDFLDAVTVAKDANRFRILSLLEQVAGLIDERRRRWSEHVEQSVETSDIDEALDPVWDEIRLERASAVLIPKRYVRQRRYRDRVWDQAFAVDVAGVPSEEAT